MILTLFGYTPPARYDDLPWTQARIEQAATETGSYTALETIDLDPVDSDPQNPQARGFTTEDATEGDWYRIVWVDGDGDESQPTLPVLFADTATTTVYGTRTELAGLLKVNETGNEGPLDRVLLVASGEITHEVGDGPLDAFGQALATEVALERAAEHWAQLKAPFGFVGLGLDGATFMAARDSFERHAFKLARIKNDWGIA
jgi:hypothetical protein